MDDLQENEINIDALKYCLYFKEFDVSASGKKNRFGKSAKAG